MSYVIRCVYIRKISVNGEKRRLQSTWYSAY